MTPARRPDDPATGRSAAARWREELAAWAIPEAVLAAAPESPWVFPVELFRVDARDPETGGPSRRRALAALPAGGTVLDVGCGGGSAALALVPPAGRVVGVDPSADLLEQFAGAAERAGVAHAEVLGPWPESAGEVDTADVVVCHHVAYNVPDLATFARALTDRARHRVVLELTDRHPLAATGPLWQHFHGISRPAGPTAGLAAAVLSDAGLTVTIERFSRPARTLRRDVLVRTTRRRLCLPAERDTEVDAMLGAAPEPPRELACLWWDVG